ncbi:mCG117554 [Mus musculus]|nr:mCG117554 [Mus musculus]
METVHATHHLDREKASPENYALCAAGLKISKELESLGLAALLGIEPKSREEGDYAMVVSLRYYAYCQS